MSKINALMIGTGEYTTGYVHGAAAESDKAAGVVALTLFDLRRRGVIEDLSIAGTQGTKFPGIRHHLQATIGDVYSGMNLSLASYPDNRVDHDVHAYVEALDDHAAGDVVTIFTPDDTHFEIAMAAVRKGCHVLVAKPLVATIDQHLALAAAAAENNVLVAVEFHKRWDPIYADARDRIRSLGDFSYFSSYMSQPKSQLKTFRSWAGRATDVSYYLNAHHIDFHAWSVSPRSRPTSVVATASTGLAAASGIATEDTITLSTQWHNAETGNMATAVYTASWIAPQSDVHSQQRFFYMGHQGEIMVDQAHRGYSVARDADGFASANPLFMKYEPDADGCFAGQNGYGYRSIEDFVVAARAIRDGQATPAYYRHRLATVDQTLLVTAILEAGRTSLDHDGQRVLIEYNADGEVTGLRLP